MSALSAALGSFGPPHTFEHGGRAYTVARLDQRAKAAFELRLWRRERERLASIREELGDDYEPQLRRLNTLYSRGRFGLASKRGLAFFESVEGKLALAAILFGVDEMEMVRLLTERTAEVTTLLELVIQESLPAAARTQSPANGSAEGKEGGGPDPNVHAGPGGKTSA